MQTETPHAESRQKPAHEKPAASLQPASSSAAAESGMGRSRCALHEAEPWAALHEAEPWAALHEAEPWARIQVDAWREGTRREGVTLWGNE